MDLPGKYSVTALFNVFDFFLFNAGDDLRANPSQEERNDGNVLKEAREDGIQGNVLKEASEDGIQISIKPVTRARLRHFKEELNTIIIKLQYDTNDICIKEEIQEHKRPMIVHVIRALMDESI